MAPFLKVELVGLRSEEKLASYKARTRLRARATIPLFIHLHRKMRSCK